ncbi:MAG: DUF2288 family protein [Myxococcales bacterium]|nr:DUF2288 family protein [Myxococcales bacterium]MCB9536946.1 DUF2288 family protein [Myxococcales bacterium]
MSDDLYTELRREVQHAEWRWVRPHHEAGRLVFVRGLDVVAVGVALATDDSASVGAWLADGRLRRGEDVDVSAWTDDDRLVFLIVQPFVVALLPDA